MYTATAEAHFGGKRVHVARALDPLWSTSAVYLWDEVVPLAAARKLAELSDGKLEVIEELYDQHGNIKSIPVKKKHRKRA